MRRSIGREEKEGAKKTEDMGDSKICMEERSTEHGRLVDEEEGEVLPGFRFHPTDEELVEFYLRRKVEKKKPISIDIIKQIDIYKYDPWDLPKLSNIGEKEWYFFCLRGRKYRNSIRPNRVTGSGFWKATGIDRPIHSSNSNSGNCIGLKKSLVYYRGSAGKGTKTDWMMHEFRLPSSHKACNNNPIDINEAESWTICRIFKRNVSFKKYTQQISWKEGVGDGGGGESSSKTSSVECDGGEEHKYLQGGASFLQGESYQVNCMEENKELYGAGQWNSNATESIKDVFKGDWDDIGRMMDYYMMEPVTTYDCIYY